MARSLAGLGANRALSHRRLLLLLLLLLLLCPDEHTGLWLQANAAVLIGAYMIIWEGKTSAEAYAPFARDARAKPFVPFRDASYWPSEYDITVQDTLVRLCPRPHCCLAAVSLAPPLCLLSARPPVSLRKLHLSTTGGIFLLLRVAVCARRRR